MAGRMREIVTIQVGNYANFIGSHFWNFQDELLGLAESPESNQVFKNHGLSMDAMYRTGETQQGFQTYTPRLVSVGFQGSLGSMSLRGTLYNEVPSMQSDVITWTGHVTSRASAPVKRNLFLRSLYEEEQDKKGEFSGGVKGMSNSGSEIQDEDIVDCLEKGVKYWTDFSKVHYHPKSLYEFSGLWIDIEEFNNYGVGRNAFSEGLRGEDINERLRFFTEECDHIQGIQFVVDDSGGFSGIAAEFLENIADDYPNVPVLLYSARCPAVGMNPKSRKLTVSGRLHDAVSFSRLSAFCKLIAPLGLQSLTMSKASRYLCIDEEKSYHSSAIYASALHSLSLPFRMELLGPIRESSYVSGAVDMNEFIQILAGQGRQNMVTAVDVTMPASLSENQVQKSFLDNLQSLTPDVAEDVEDLQAAECITVHGVFRSGLERASVSEVKDRVQAAYENAATRPRFSHLSAAQCPLPIPLPFPSIFRNVVGQHGELLPIPASGSLRGSLDVHSIPMAARLRSSTGVLPFLESRLTNLRKYGLDQGAIGSELLRSWGFGRDEVEDIAETLSKMVTTLNPYSDISSDSD